MSFLRLRSCARAFALVSSVFFVAACGEGSETPAPANPQAEAPPGGEQEAVEPPAPNALATRLDAFFAELTKKDGVSGNVLVVDGGKTVLSKGYGFAARATETPPTPTTIFRIASMSKQFTASAMLALVAEGKVSLTDPIAKYFPEYPKENLEKDGTAVTIHHLLSHTSGVPNMRETDYFKSNVFKRPIEKQTLLGAGAKLPLVRKPGEKYEYSNSGFFLAALIIERVTNKSYEAFLKERFFDPFGMKDTGTF